MDRKIAIDEAAKDMVKVIFAAAATEAVGDYDEARKRFVRGLLTIEKLRTDLLKDVERMG